MLVLMRLILATATAVSTVLAGLASAWPAQATFPGRNGEIAYIDAAWSVGYGMLDEARLYGVCGNGSGKRRLLSGGLPYTGNWLGLSAESGVFSPNGRWLAASGQPHPRNDVAPVGIYVGAVEGRKLRRVTPLVGAHGEDVDTDSPVWSPDGRAIAFRAMVDNGPDAVRIRRLGGRSRFLARGSDPAWSVRDEIAFTREVSMPQPEDEIGPDTRDALYVVSATGGVERELHGGSPWVEPQPNWSPDGQRIVFNSRWKGKTYITVISRDGSALRRLARGRSASWSPDGRLIVFRTPARRPGRTDSYAAVISPTGRGLRRLGLLGEYQAPPIFSPDSLWVVAAWKNLYVVRVNGTHKHYVAFRKRGYLMPLDWRPRPASASLSSPLANVANGRARTSCR